MSLDLFHPAVARWFSQRFGAPTRAQAQGWEAIRSGRHTLIAAPTGSGKTLAAFLSALDELLREGQGAPLPDETRVLYVSPLKALTADIHYNLTEPRREIRQTAEAMGAAPVRITAAIRTGDTPPAARTAMLRKPPHILVTTPESLYLLLTAERSREMLRTVRTVIVDEIHAVLESRRGAHLALSLERLRHLTGREPQRIGLSATQRPIETVAAYLTGRDDPESCAIIDEGHRRSLDLGLEVPGAPLETVMSAEVWEEVYDRLAGLIQEHRTTLVFVNTRRLAERAARHLAERLGEAAVTAHHGSLSKEARLDAEERLKSGQLRALVATASLELGIDIGHVDLVCQLGSPRRISTFLQRVGRAGHSVQGTPRGRLFPLSRDELVECAALLRAVHRGDLDRLRIPPQPLDVLAQQLVAETACQDWDEETLFQLTLRAWPYRALRRQEFDETVTMLAQGFSTRRGRRGALVHHDAVNHRLRGRRGARLLALTSGGAIPDNADYRVVLEPEGTFLGSLNEDFAVESMAGDVFQLGNTSWRILRIERGVVRVEDARGEPPNIPFWLGEAPGRSTELSREVSRLRAELEPRLDDLEAAAGWLLEETGLGTAAAMQLLRYLAEARRVLGALPTQDCLVAERFFDEAGGMQLVIHSPFGSRVNRAWGLALRKRFCRQFNFELQAAATEDGILLSLGPQHSFPLEEVFRFLQPESAESILVQALLDAPMFGTHWRWNATIALAIPRSRGGRKVAPQLQRMQAEDLLAAVFPDAAACLENIAGDREVPDHLLARQTIADCLHDVMDIDGLRTVLERIRGGEVRLVARDLPEPSSLASEVLNARVYAFLDDAPLEERRTQAVYSRRALEPSSAGDLGALDAAAIDRVREEGWPDPRDADEMHDALLTSGVLQSEWGDGMAGGGDWAPLLEELRETGRAGKMGEFWFATERVEEIRAAYPGELIEPSGLQAPGVSTRPERQAAIRELARGQLEIRGPVTSAGLAEALGIASGDAEIALAELEAEGTVLRGYFTPETTVLEWCHRRLLARIHRYTLVRLRSEIEPVSTADFMRFLFTWQRVEPENRASGLEGLAAVLDQLDGFELPAGAWESDVLSLRINQYDPGLLDMLCLTGRVAWGRLSHSRQPEQQSASRPVRSTPVALFRRHHAERWRSLTSASAPAALSTYATLVASALQRRGASFFPQLVRDAGLLATQVEEALGELAAVGRVTSDAFSGLRALITPAHRRPPVGARGRTRQAPAGVEAAGRWALIRDGNPGEEEGIPEDHPGDRTEALEAFARTLLRRYGVVFRRLLARESLAPPWRELVMIYRRLEARGEIRGGRFVAGVSGEQFALAEAVGSLRSARRREKTGRFLSISAADPLNLTGIVTPGPRVPAFATHRIVYLDGVPLASREGGEVRPMAAVPPERLPELERVLVRQRPVEAGPVATERAG